jgi:hypothetical protein
MLGQKFRQDLLEKAQWHAPIPGSVPMRDAELYVARGQVWESLKEVNKSIADDGNALAVDPTNKRALWRVKRLNAQRPLVIWGISRGPWQWLVLTGQAQSPGLNIVHREGGACQGRRKLGEPIGRKLRCCSVGGKAL